VYILYIKVYIKVYEHLNNYCWKSIRISFSYIFYDILFVKRTAWHAFWIISI